jgi:predicted transcriptional regulator
MKAQKTKQSKTAATRQVGLRLDSNIAEEIRRLAEADERDLTYVLTKIIQIGLPIFRDRQKAA